MDKKDFRIMVIDDEPSFLLLLTRILEDEGYTVGGFNRPDEALRAMTSAPPHLVVTDLKMPGMDGISLMEEARKISPSMAVVMITAFATVETAVSAMKMGAVDYITKPLESPDQLREIVLTAFAGQAQQLKGDGSLEPPVEVIFAGIEEVLREVRDVAPTDATVLLTGETGTGKTLIARTMHLLSSRKGPFVDINCAAIPENLLESELFGYEKGAFTGAVSAKKGKFEAANNGTVFLDEVSEMNLAIQAKFLTVLQEKRFQRLGSVESHRTNARIIAATNRDLRELMRSKGFREDLYYRLSVFPIHIPPLRERKDAIVPIARYLISAIAARLGKTVDPPSDTVLGGLTARPWQGNIRELENMLERAIIISRGRELSLPALSHNERRGDMEMEGDLKSMERSAIENALERTQGNRKKAAEILGISLRTLQYKIKEYGMTR